LLQQRNNTTAATTTCCCRFPAQERGGERCCQLADISAAKYKKGNIKILVARKSVEEFFADLSKNSRKVVEFFEVCSLNKSLDNLQT
jgi:hypothetical protein